MKQPADLRECVARALAEDIGSGDITARLVPDQSAVARVITREAAVICGAPYVNEVFRQLSRKVKVSWRVKEGARVKPDQVLFTLSGPARALLTGELPARNFLQTLSGTATAVAQ